MASLWKVIVRNVTADEDTRVYGLIHLFIYLLQWTHFLTQFISSFFLLALNSVKILCLCLTGLA